MADLHDTASKAEALAYPDARTACFHARRSLEVMVHWLYKHDAALKLSYQDNLSALSGPRVSALFAIHDSGAASLTWGFLVRFDPRPVKGFVNFFLHAGAGQRHLGARWRRSGLGEGPFQEEQVVGLRR